jgi:outer membrane protein OmpA-like peptidoglycan-associated protein
MNSKLTPRGRIIGLLILVCMSPWAGSTALAQSEPISIFFDLQKSTLVPSSRQIVAAVSDVIKSKPGVQLTVVGFCDTSETNPAKLSLARAIEVAKAFADIGIAPDTQITVLGKGYSELRKPTGPNVREPINRYVRITIDIKK